MAFTTLTIKAQQTNNTVNTIKGTITDQITGETIVGATITIQGKQIGDVSDINGQFTLETKDQYPIEITVRFLGYKDVKITVKEKTKGIKVNLETDQTILKEIEIVDKRITDKQKESPLTIEGMDITDIRAAPSGDFYRNLGSMKGVDMTTASIGFKVINTRGFNSTTPVRSLQIIDGVDNQSPGLNFSLGNFMGAAALDIKRVNIISGASSAYYGPGAFNGVISFETKDPYYFPGLSTSVKLGERKLAEINIRWAKVIDGKKKKKKFGYKLNLYYLRADDWKADNYDATQDSKDPITNPGGWDAVNIYGDEDVDYNNDFTGSQGKALFPGLNRFYRTGYKEVNITNYDTYNAKANVGLYYKINPKIMGQFSINYGTGTTIYHGDNRFKLKGIHFVQTKLEIEKKRHLVYTCIHHTRKCRTNLRYIQYRIKASR